MPKKERRGFDGLFGGIKDAFDSLDDSFEVIEKGMDEGFIDAGMESTTARGVSRQTVHGEGYEIRVTRAKEGPAVIVIASDSSVKIIVNGKEIGAA